MAQTRPRVLVVNGGPGLGSSYMRDAFESLQSSVSLRFYDQLGCGGAQNGDLLSVEATVRQFESIYEEESQRTPPGILAHSWGTVLVLLASLRSVTNVRDADILFCNPSPLTAKR